MTKCALKNCKNASSKRKKKDGVSYFTFPQNVIQREKWRQFVAAERGEELYKPNKTSVVCSDHFLATDLYYSNKGYKMKKKSAVPELKVSSKPPAFQKVQLQPCSSNTAYSSVSMKATENIEDNREYCPTEVLVKTEKCEIDLYSQSTLNETNDTRSDLDFTKDNREYVPVEVFVKTEKSEIDLYSQSTLDETKDARSDLDCTKDNREHCPVEVFVKTEKSEIDLYSQSTLDETTDTRDDLECTKLMTSSVSSSFLNASKIAYLKKKMGETHRKLVFKTRQVKNLKRQNDRLKKKYTNLRELMNDLKKRRFVDEALDDELSEDLQNSENIVKILLSRRKTPFSKIPPALKKFALTLHCYSPSAYKYLRSKFEKILPHSHTLNRWYESKDSEPGFTSEAFPRLADDTSTSLSSPLPCSLTADETAIRQ